MLVITAFFGISNKIEAFSFTTYEPISEIDNGTRWHYDSEIPSTFYTPYNTANNWDIALSSTFDISKIGTVYNSVNLGELGTGYCGIPLVLVDRTTKQPAFGDPWDTRCIYNFSNTPAEPEPEPEILFPYTVSDVGTVATSQGVEKVIGGYQTSAGGFLTSKVTNTYGETEGVLNWEILTYFNCVACTFPSGSDYPTLYFYHENPLGKELKPYYSITLPVQKNKDDIYKFNIITNANGNLTRLYTNTRTGQKITSIYWEENISIPGFNMETDYVVLSKDSLKQYRGSGGDYFLKTNNPPTYITTTTMNERLNPISFYPTTSYASFPYKVNGSNISFSPLSISLDLCNDGIQNQDETGIDTGGICDIDDIYIANFDITTFDNATQVDNVYKYEGENFKEDINFKIFGNNPLNQFDKYTLDIYENGMLLKKTINGEINFSCGDNCNLFNFPASQFNYEFIEGKTYTFKVVLDGVLYNPMTKWATVGYNVIPEVLKQEDLRSDCGNDIFCKIMSSLENQFVPSDETLEKLRNLTLRNSFPFSYIYDMGNLYDNLFNQEVKSFDISIAFGSFGNLTLLSTEKLQAISFQPLIRTILGALLYFGTTMLVYRRILSIFNKETEVHNIQ